MRNAIIGTVICFILAVVCLVVTPMYYIGIIEWARSESEVLSDARNLIDEVIDTRRLTEDMLADFDLALAAKSSYYRATITREVKVINPDPANPGQTYTNYIVMDKMDEWTQGDLIIVDIENIGTNIFRSMARIMLGMNIMDSDIRLVGRVR